MIGSLASAFVVAALWSAPAPVTKPIDTTLTFVGGTDRGSPPGVTWHQGGDEAWVRQTAGGWTKPEYIDKSDDVALYGGGGAWQLGWRSDRVNLWRRADERWHRVSRLAGGENYWFKVGIAGQLALVEISHGKALLAYGTPAHPPRTQRVVGAGKPKHFDIALSPAGKRGGVAWDSPSGLWERTFTAGKLGKPVRLASGKYPGRGVVSAAADDGTVVVAWLAGKPLADVFLAVVRPGHATGYYKLGPLLKPDTAPQVEAGPGGRGLLAYSGADASGQHGVWGVSLNAWRPATQVLVSTPGAKARLDQTNAAGDTEGMVWHESGADGTAIFAAFTWPGSALTAERVSAPDTAFADPFSASLAFDACTGVPLVVWSARAGDAESQLVSSERSVAPGAGAGC